jgi:hypothetical protein
LHDFYRKVHHIVKHILLNTATAILLLHGFIPHQHHGELSIAEHAREHTSDNIFDYLRTVFHLDLNDQQHLENYEVNQTTCCSVEISIEQIPAEISLDQTPVHGGGFGDASIDCEVIIPPEFPVPVLDFHYCPGRGRFPDTASFLSLFAFSNTGLRGPPVG